LYRLPHLLYLAIVFCEHDIALAAVRIDLYEIISPVEVSVTLTLSPHTRSRCRARILALDSSVCL
jgi:hypothetical protein